MSASVPRRFVSSRAFLLYLLAGVGLLFALIRPPAPAAAQTDDPPPAASQSQADALDEALALVGMCRADLGWTPKGWWPRYPADIPYKLRAFDALFAEPLDTVTFARGLGQAAYEMLDPAQLAKEDLGRNSRSLFQVVQRLGIDPKFGGFRGYTANVLAPETPLEQAVLALYRAAQRTTRPHTFGMELPYPRIEERLAEEVKKLPEGVSPIIGQLVMNLIEARRWVDLAFRKVDAADRLAAATNYDVGIEMIDAYDYRPEMDDVARAWDEASMWYAAQQCVDALDLARIKLQKWEEAQAGAVPHFGFAWETPWGWIIVRGGLEPGPGGFAPGPLDPVAGGAVEPANTLFVISLGDQHDYYTSGAAGTALQPISLILDLGGDDTYDVGDAPHRPVFGAGLTGIGVLIDAAGSDSYRAPRYAQGVGQFGLGLLADLGGDDTYDVQYSGQGCGYFGVGLLFDVDGNDLYKIYADGQGLGGVAGVGILADRSGDDHYFAERQHTITGRPSYHSPNLDVGVSNAQGVGMGRRGDGADGHSWAGGLGALLDGGGNDAYASGNWAMGTGYWFGIGVLHDRDGDDVYEGVAYTQGTGAHFCIGALIDEGGNDQHLAQENSHSSLAWAHDFTVGLLINLGGDDLYSVDSGGLSYSINRSVSMLIDVGGDDIYTTDIAQRTEKKHGQRPGYAANSEQFRARGGVGTYFADTTSLGLFLDVGGNDKYEGKGAKYPAEVGNDHQWLDPQDDPNWADRNFSVGVDRPEGEVRFTSRPVRAPSAAGR